MKTRLFRTVVAFLFAGLALTQVGCYDQQIDDLNNRIDELTTGKIASIESQYSSLQTTLSSLQSADAAMTTKIAALEAGSKEVADLKAAQATLQAAIDAVEAQLDGFLTKTQLDATLASYATAKDVADVVANLGKFAKEADIQAAINEAKDAAIAAAGEAMKESFQTSFDAAFAKAAAGLASTADVEAKIAAALKTADEAIAAAVKTAIEKYDGEITAAVAEQLAAVKAELIKYIQARLTSLQVKPELFVNGIETVELQSFIYTPLAINVNEAGDNETVAVAKDKDGKDEKEVTTSALTTTVNYYVSPSHVTTDDIKAAEVEFRCHTAATVTRADEAAPVQVKSASIEKGILSVELVKTASNVAVNAGQGKTWVGAAVVPIVDKYLAANEAAATVTSDYVALIETSVKPQIAAAKYACTAAAGHKHYYASFDEAKEEDAVISMKAQFNDSINLTKMVTGCDGTKELTVKALNNAGLEFVFEIPTTTFAVKPNNTDQQQFAKIVVENGVCYAVPVLPDGTLNNEAAVGKTPIVRVKLVDTKNDNAIVDVQYIKIAWTEGEPMGTEALDYTKTFEYTLSCAEFVGKVLWKDMITEILAKLNGNGMSFDEFVANYTLAEVEAEDEDEEIENGSATFSVNPTVSEDAPAIVWTMTPAEIGKVMNVDGTLIAEKATKTIDLMFVAKNNYTHKNYTFQLVMNVKLPVMPVMNGYRSALWSVDGVLANVYPVQYKPEFAHTRETETCSYNYDFDQLFVGGQIVKNLLPCGKWAYTWTEEAEEIVENAVEMKYVDTYKGVATPETEGATNVAEAITDEFVKLIEDEERIPIGWGQGATNYVPTAEAKAILGKTAAMNVMAQINPYNEYKVSTFELNFVEPLKVNTTLVEGNFVDKVIGGSKIDCSKAFGLTDFVDYLVAKTTPAEATEKQQYAAQLWDYYGVGETTWDLAKAVINIVKDANGNEVVDDTLTAETAKMKAEDYFGKGCLTINRDKNELTFVNVNGADVAKVCKVYIPVTVSHKWGETSANVAIEIHPAF